MDGFLHTFFDQTISGLVIGNIYALTAVGLALIFGVGNLINFAHGSVYMIGAYVGWAAITYLNAPLPLALLAVALVCGCLGLLIERIGLRHHKLSLVMQLSDHVVVMDNGRKIAGDPPDQVRFSPRVIEAFLGHKDSQRQSGPSSADLPGGTPDPFVRRPCGASA